MLSDGWRCFVGCSSTILFDEQRRSKLKELFEYVGDVVRKYIKGENLYATKHTMTIYWA